MKSHQIHRMMWIIDRKLVSDLVKVQPLEQSFTESKREIHTRTRTGKALERIFSTQFRLCGTEAMAD